MNIMRGQTVFVRAYPNKILERVALEQAKTYVLCCRKEKYEEMLKTGQPCKDYMGFPIEDIVEAKALCPTIA